MSSPLVSIGVPVYNGEDYLEETLASLLGQDYPDVEIVVSDNGSLDASLDIAKAAAVEDSRIRVLTTSENRGAAWNYNRVLAEASGSLFKWAAADDVCAPAFISRCVEHLAIGGPEMVVAFPQTLIIDAERRPLQELEDSLLDLSGATPHERLGRLLRHRVEWHPVFGVIRTDVLRGTGKIGRFASADIVLLAELAMRGRFGQVRERLFLRRYHNKRSIVAGPSPSEQLAWYDPQRRSRVAFPESRLNRELLAAVTRAPLSGAERARCAGEVLRRWTAPHLRHIGGEARNGLIRDPWNRRRGR